MFDANKFKQSVKAWIRENPDGTVAEIIDFCEDQIPPAQYASYQWLVDQTVDWYKHILAHREASRMYETEDDAAIA